MKRLLAITLATAALLSACSNDCPSCTDIRQPATLDYTFTLCISEVPTFDGPNDDGCGAVAVEYIP